MGTAAGPSTPAPHHWTPIDSHGNWNAPPTDESIKKGRLEQTIAALYQQIDDIKSVVASHKPVTLKNRFTPESEKATAALEAKQFEIQTHKDELAKVHTKVIKHIEKDWGKLTNIPVIGYLFRLCRDYAIQCTNNTFTELTQKLNDTGEGIKAKLASTKDLIEIVSGLNTAFLKSPHRDNFQNIHTEEQANEKLIESSSPGVTPMLFRRDPDDATGFIISVKPKKDSPEVKHIRITIEIDPGYQLSCTIKPDEPDDKAPSSVSSKAPASSDDITLPAQTAATLEDLLEAENWEEVSKLIGYS
jgi:hypothetical protein